MYLQGREPATARRAKGPFIHDLLLAGGWKVAQDEPGGNAKG